MQVIRVESPVIASLYVEHIHKDTRGYYRFGDTDDLINYIINVVNASGTASSCVDKLSKFIVANGFEDPAVGRTKANPFQTYNAVASELAINEAYSEVVTFRVLFNNSGDPARIYPVPIQNLRRRGRNLFLYNELMGYHGKTNAYDRWLQGFDPTESPQSRLNRIGLQIKNYGEQIGDIVYYFRKGVGPFRDVYRIPGYFAGIDDIESDAALSKLDKRNIKRGWRTPIIVSTGPMDKYQKDDKGETQYDRFTNTIKKFAGEDAAIALHLEGATNETKPDVKTISLAEILDATDRSTERVGRKVCRHFDVPPILVGFATAGQLGNVQELKNTMDLFKLTVIDRQNLISEALSLVFPGQNWKLTSLNLWSETPQK